MKAGVKLSAESLLGDLRSERRFAVVIDDTGSPGDKNTPPTLHPFRKSWVSVVLTPEQAAEVSQQLPQALEDLRTYTGASEFHFTDIYSGRRAFANVPEETRLNLFAFMAFIFTTYRFPIIVQTLDPDNASYQSFRAAFPEKVAYFKMSRPGDVALLMLLCRTKWFLREQGVTADTAARVFVDEGERFMKHGNAINLQTFAEVFEGGLICFSDSRRVPHIQLADFAAFSLNRTQWLLGKPTLSPFDAALIQILSPVSWNYVNLKQVVLPGDWWSSSTERPLN
jgi:hypothetical protein